MAYRISKVSIHNYRSVKNLSLIVPKNGGPIVICGSNNVGKTNFLRAVDLFFNETNFKALNDIPYEIVEATRGAGYKTTISIDFVDNKLNTYITIIKKLENDDDNEASEWLCHETVHCVRSQYHRLGLRQTLSYGFVEETIAYSIDKPGDTKTMLRVFPAIMQGIMFSPFLLGAYLFYPIANITTFSCIGMSLYYGYKTASFFKKCEDEGLNPFYLFLRSSPSEYPKKEPVRDQLYENDNVRFRIMANGLGLIN